ncbi:cupredoxin domain-containing protein [Streptomyces olivaceoviridis]|uniref:hypothetical protein n=1 Tax=Streptomyces olivaceoviridis TaxID=1921 RepID=UPI0036FFE11F
MHAVRLTIEVAPGIEQQMWTFGGTAPGPTLHGKVGDVFEVTFVNDDPTMGHGRLADEGGTRVRAGVLRAVSRHPWKRGPGGEDASGHPGRARVFNGVAAQYAKVPLTVKAGKRARFRVVAAGPSDGISFHVVGTVFDTVYREGAYLLRPGEPGGSQALDLTAAQGGFVETTFPAAGHYSLVDHDMRHAESGSMGMVEVSR